MVEAVAETNGVDTEKPWQKLSAAEREIFLQGTGSERHKVSYRNRFGRSRSYSVRFEGIVNNLERRYGETDSERVRERIEGYMAEQPCPECKGATAAAREPRGQGGRHPASPSSAPSRRARPASGSGGWR